MKGQKKNLQKSTPHLIFFAPGLGRFLGRSLTRVVGNRSMQKSMGVRYVIPAKWQQPHSVILQTLLHFERSGAARRRKGWSRIKEPNTPEANLRLSTSKRERIEKMINSSFCALLPTFLRMEPNPRGGFFRRWLGTYSLDTHGILTHLRIISPTLLDFPAGGIVRKNYFRTERIELDQLKPESRG